MGGTRIAYYGHSDQQAPAVISEQNLMAYTFLSSLN